MDSTFAPQNAPCVDSLPVMSRVWAMPNAETFSVPEIAGFVRKYLMRSKVSVDPFARNKRWATYTNDLNPGTAADSHLEAADFLRGLLSSGVRADLIIFDPPYNPAQAKECYESIGLANTLKSAQSGGVWAEEKDVAAQLLVPNGIFLWFGWNTCGMGKGRGFVIIEILLVSHGRGKNDTICMAERRVTPQPTLNFGDAPSVGDGNENHLAAQDKPNPPPLPAPQRKGDN